VQPGLDRPGGDAEAVGDVIDAEVKVEPQRDDDPVIPGQALERAVEDKAVIDAAQPVGGLAVVAFGLDLDDGSAALPAQSVTTRVDQDPLEPGFEPGWIPKRSIPFPRRHDGVVGRVLGLDPVPQDDPGQSIGRVEVLIGQRREGGASIDDRRHAFELRGRHSGSIGCMPYPTI